MKSKPKRIQRPRLEHNKRSDICAYVIDNPESPPMGVHIEGMKGDLLQIDRKDAERLLVFLGKAIAYIDGKAKP